MAAGRGRRERPEARAEGSGHRAPVPRAGPEPGSGSAQDSRGRQDVRRGLHDDGDGSRLGIEAWRLFAGRPRLLRPWPPRRRRPRPRGGQGRLAGLHEPLERLRILVRAGLLEACSVGVADRRDIGAAGNAEDRPGIAGHGCLALEDRALVAVEGVRELAANAGEVARLLVGDVPLEGADEVLESFAAFSDLLRIEPFRPREKRLVLRLLAGRQLDRREGGEAPIELFGGKPRIIAKNLAPRDAGRQHLRLDFEGAVGVPDVINDPILRLFRSKRIPDRSK